MEFLTLALKIAGILIALAIVLTIIDLFFGDPFDKNKQI